MQPWCTLRFFGDGVEQSIEQDYGKARHYYELAASQGDANSQCKLGHLYYYDGMGVELRNTILVISTTRKDLVWSKTTTKQGTFTN
jgi:TPR repeat protein